jgi:hypothetical protein
MNCFILFFLKYQLFQKVFQNYCEPAVSIKFQYTQMYCSVNKRYLTDCIKTSFDMLFHGIFKKVKD